MHNGIPTSVVIEVMVAILQTSMRPGTTWYISSAKARGLLGYAPRHSIFDMVDEALDCMAAQG